MGYDEIEEFKKEREKLNKIVMEYGRLHIKRFFNLDEQVYKKEALSKRVKELLGLVSSFVLRCDDCVKYHLMRCMEEGISDEKLEEALAIGLIVGDSITIPHIRIAFKVWDEMKKQN